jgi:Tol biopolymer transport system component
MLVNAEDVHRKKSKGCLIFLIIIAIILLGIVALSIRYEKTLGDILGFVTKQNAQTINGKINLANNVSVNGAIYFVKNKNLWKISGSNITQVTTSGKIDEATVSPDGTTVIYSTLDNNFANMYEMNTTTGTITALDTQLNGNANIYNYLWYVDGAISSNDKEIALLSDKAKFATGVSDLSVYSMNLATPKVMKQITQGNPYTGGDQDPVFYPLNDNYLVYNKYVYYTDTQPQPYSELHVMDIAHQQSYLISDAGAGTLQPSFSSDGKYLVFAKRDTNDSVANQNTSIYIMPFNIAKFQGTTPQQAFAADYAQKVLVHQGLDSMPVFSPNNNQIAFIEEDNGTFDLYRINISLTNSKTGALQIKTSDLVPITQESEITSTSRISWIGS